ncbi:MAG: 50S ribosomal protein L10 [Candidatus Omnitrophota bacterium]
MKKAGLLVRESASQHIKSNVESHSNVFLMSYTQVSSGQMDTLRKNLKKIGASVHVTKNSIAQRVLKDLEKEKLIEWLEGQMAFIFSGADSAEISKTLINFSKGCEGVLVRGGLCEGKLLTKEDVKRLSELPSKEVLLSILLGTIQAPLTRLASALNAKTRDLIYILKQLSEKKGGN